MSKTSIADSEEYKEFELRHNRPLNMVQDSVSKHIHQLHPKSNYLNHICNYIRTETSENKR